MFVDSRVDLFVYAGVFKDYIDILELKDSIALLDKLRIHYVLFPPNEPLTYLLTQDSAWKVLFKGNVSVLLERVAPGVRPSSTSECHSRRIEGRAGSKMSGKAT